MNSERRKDCPMRHPDNGNCLPAGGFCTAVNNIICDALHSAHIRGYVMASEKYTEVVRCGTCIYYAEVKGKDSGKPCGYGSCTKPFHMTGIITNADFCSFGERRADG